MNQDEVKRNLLSLDQWLRMLLMACYLVVAWVVGIVLVVIMVAQTLVVLITAELNVNLQKFGAVSAAYLYQIVIYLVYGTDEKPFPFNALPGMEEATVATEILTPDDAPDPDIDLDLDTDNGTQNQG